MMYSLYNKCIVNSHYKNFADSFFLEFLIILKISRDMGGTRRCESARNTDLGIDSLHKHDRCEIDDSTNYQDFSLEVVYEDLLVCVACFFNGLSGKMLARLNLGMCENTSNG
jgi:hypothetical protein